MTVLGMPASMFLVFTATLLAGSLAAIHYVTVHVILGKPANKAAQSETGDLHNE
jgi:hypothetical protein